MHRFRIATKLQKSRNIGAKASSNKAFQDLVLKRTITFAIIGIGLLCFKGQKALRAQDPQFTQFYANKLYLNPAFAGTYECPRAVMSYRNQWAGINESGGGVFETMSASYDQHVSALSGGLGLLVTNDNAGVALRTTRVSGIYSYRLQVTRQFDIRAGLQATWFQRGLDWNELTFGDMIDPRKGFIYNTQNRQQGGQVSGADFSAGILGNSERYFFGAAVHHMNQPDESLTPTPPRSPLPAKITGHAGARIPLVDSRYSDNEMTLSPNILFQQQGNFRQLNLGAYLKKGPIVGGVWYRTRDAIIALVGFETDMFKFGYSYDVTISPLANASQGAHELSLTINFDCPPNERKFRTISCPSF